MSKGMTTFLNACSIFLFVGLTVSVMAYLTDKEKGQVQDFNDNHYHGVSINE